MKYRNSELYDQLCVEHHNERDPRMKVVKDPHLGVRLQEIIDNSVVNKSGEAVANFLRKAIKKDLVT